MKLLRAALLIFLLMTVGASGAQWSVKYNLQEICAVKGSTVFMNGSYTHPERLTVTKVYWVLNPVPGVEPADLSINPDYSDRVEYLTDKQKHFSLKLSNVMKKDEHEYSFRIISDKEKWSGTPGVKLRVTDLHVEPPGEVTEGETAVLTCRTTCSLTDPTFIWYRNGHPLTTKTMEKNQLHLQAVRREDAGSYSCAVRGHELLPSPEHTLTVRYPPKNVSVSISPSNEIMEGSSINLTCSSDGNPPVQNYTWFIEGGPSPVGSGHSYSPVQSGSYYCEAQNEHGAQRSAAVLIISNDHFMVLYFVVAGVFAITVVFTVVFWLRRKKSQDTDTDEDDNVNADRRAKPPADDSSKIPVYENVENVDLSADPTDGNSSSISDYENVENLDPPDGDSCSVPDYENVDSLRKQR